MLHVAIVLIEDPSSGRIFVHRRRDDKAVFPGLLGFGIGGRLEPGETPAQGAARELFEEAGLTSPITPITSFRFPNPSGACHVHLFHTQHDGPIPNHDEEWTWSRWMDIPAAEEAIAEGRVCPDTSLAWARACELLAVRRRD